MVWLNGIRTTRTAVSDAGDSVEAWFLEPLEALREAAVARGGWELVFQPHAPGQQAYRVSPTGDPADAAAEPRIEELTE